MYSINVAAWLRFGLASDDRMIMLCLSYKDTKGEHVVLVEEQCVKDKTSAMFSSLTDLVTTGPLLELNVACAGLRDEDRCYIEDISLTRQEDEISRSA